MADNEGVAAECGAAHDGLRADMGRGPERSLDMETGRPRGAQGGERARRVRCIRQPYRRGAGRFSARRRTLGQAPTLGTTDGHASDPWKPMRRALDWMAPGRIASSGARRPAGENLRAPRLA